MFRFSDLPFLPLKEILKKLSTQELLDLTLTSKDLQEIVRRIPIRSGGYTVSLDENCELLIQMDELPYTFQRFDREKEVLFDVLEECYGYFEKVFGGEINQLNVCPFTYYDHLNRIPKNCNILSIGQNPECYTESDLETMEECPQDVLDSFLNHVNFKILKLNGPKQMKTENPKIFNVDCIEINDCGWMKPSTFERFQNKLINLENVSISEEDVNEILQKLKNGTGFNQLEIMSLRRKNEWNMARIVSGLDTSFISKQTFKTNFDFVPFGYRNKTVLYDSHNFTKNDGTRISVDIRFSEYLRIFVWNDEVK